jgi:hypothetical protein
MPNTDPEDEADPWEVAVDQLADRLVTEADRFVRSFPPEPHLRPVLIRQALELADKIVTSRLAEGRGSGLY